MIPRLVPEISPLDAFCDVVVVAGVAGVVVGIGILGVGLLLLLYFNPDGGEGELNMYGIQGKFFNLPGSSIYRKIKPNCYSAPGGGQIREICL